MFSKTAKVKSIMRENPICISTEDSLARIGEIFRSFDFHHLPVSNQDGEIIGIISHGDLKYAMEQIAKNSSGKVYTQQILNHWDAERIMTHNPTFLHTDDPISKAAKYFLENKFHALPILDENNQLVGILTSHDLLEYAYKD